MSLLELRGITKAFGGLRVLEGVDFDVRAAEANALAGENGAGKSTLVNIVSGVARRRLRRDRVGGPRGLDPHAARRRRTSASPSSTRSLRPRRS